MRVRSEPQLQDTNRKDLADRLCRFLTLSFFLMFFSSSHSVSGGEVRWSPNGNWLAFRQDLDSGTAKRLSPGWLLEPERFSEKATPRNSIEVNDRILWIGRADLDLWHEVVRSVLYLSEPAWSPDGTGLFFARVETQADGTLRWSLVKLYEMSRSGPKTRVILSRDLPKDWRPPESGSRGWVALNQLHAGPSGLLIHGDPVSFDPVLVNVDSQEVLARFPEGYNARIGRSGEAVAWLRSEDWPPHSADLVMTDLKDGQNRQIKNVLPDAFPVFSSDGRSLYIGRHQKPQEGISVPPGSDWPDIAKVDTKDFKPQRFSRPIATPVIPSERLLGLSFALDEEEESLFCSPIISPRAAEISWFLPKTAATYKRFPPLDFDTNATDLSLSIGQRLALRLGQSERYIDSSALPAALCDPRSEILLPLVPDDRTVDVWIDFLVRAVYRNLKQDPGAADPQNSAKPDRFSLVPSVEELVPESPSTVKLRRIGNVGLRVLGFDPKDPDPKRLDRLSDSQSDAAALFFALTNHNAEAVKALGVRSNSDLDESHRGRMIALNAQLKIAAGQVEEAKLILNALSASETKDLGQLSPDGQGGWALTSVDSSPWREFLARLNRLADELPRSAEGLLPHNPFGHFNPDDPENDPDLIVKPPSPLAP